MMTEVILTVVCEHYQIKRLAIGEEVTGRSIQKVVEAKQTAAYFLWRYTRLTREQIANILGYHRPNNINMCKNKIKEIMSANKGFAADLGTMESKILRD